jgi:hypothetical protein
VRSSQKKWSRCRWSRMACGSILVRQGTTNWNPSPVLLSVAA